MTLTLRRGDARTMTIGNLRDKDDQPTTLSDSDLLRWTAKLAYADADTGALIAKTSPAGGITFQGGADHATITIVASDWDDIWCPVDQSFVWDLQLAPAGDVEQIVTLCSGDGIIEVDVTRTVP